MSAALERGMRVGSVVLEERVGSGGFAEVWRGRTGDSLEVAVKVATSDMGARLLRSEVEILRRLRRLPGILEVVEFLDGEPPSLAMPWVGGRTLRDELATPGPRAVARILDLVRIVARVHGRGVVHGDLKPENVLAGEAVHLLDFGLARETQKRRLESRLADSLRTEEVGGGTLAYLPPEAVKGAEPSMRADVYALGVMLHEALFGRRPGKATSPEELRTVLDERALEVLLRALAFAPEDRYPDAAALLGDLEAHWVAFTMTGPRRALRSVKRFVLIALAAFFVVLRYTSVAALLVGYAAILYLAATKSPAVLLSFLAFALLHAVIRWEGPESPEEARLRNRRGVVSSEASRRRR